MRSKIIFQKKKQKAILQIYQELLDKKIKNKRNLRRIYIQKKK